MKKSLNTLKIKITSISLLTMFFTNVAYSNEVQNDVMLELLINEANLAADSIEQAHCTKNITGFECIDNTGNITEFTLSRNVDSQPLMQKSNKD